MGTTNTYALRYRDLSDTPDIPETSRFLAEDVEAELERIDAAAAAEITRLNDLLEGTAEPTQTGSGTLGVGGTGTTIKTVSIPDPGYAYYIFASGSCPWGVIAGSVSAAVFELAVTIDSTAYNSGVLTKGLALSVSTSASFSQATAHASPSRSASQTGAKTVRLIARNSGPSSYTIPATSLECTLHVRIAPA